MSSDTRYEGHLLEQGGPAFIVEVPGCRGVRLDVPTYRWTPMAAAEIVIAEWIETAKELGRRSPNRRAG